MIRRAVFAMLGAAAYAGAFADGAVPLSDDAMKEKIVSFVTLPSRLCGRATLDFRDELKSWKLTNRSWFDGDTNRLARLICELAQTNDNRIARTMIRTLGEYGTPAQLPFLYSCATNPVLGKTAVESVLRIEGVTSNSLAVAQSYVSLTNGFPLMNTDDRPDVCRSVVTKVFADDTLVAYRPYVMDIACSFAKDVNVLPKGLDKTLVSLAPDFRMTKRRLAILRSAGQRVEEKFYSADTNAVHYSIEAHIYDVQTNYLANAINELVAYPEADLPD